MSAFLRRLRARQVELSPRDGRLRISAPKGVLTPELRAEIAARKVELLAALGVETPPDESVASQPRRVPISWAQRRFWFLQQLAPDSAFYNIFLAARLRGPLDVDVLRRALSELVRRHESLRTTLETSSAGDVEAFVHHPPDVPLPVVDITSEAEVISALEHERKQPLAPTTVPMLRAKLLRCAREDHVLAMTTHHFACDGWSWRLVPAELAHVYVCLSSGLPLPPLPKAQYADFADWQEQYLSSEDASAALIHWQAELRAPLPQLDLPTDRLRPPLFSTRGATVPITLAADLGRAVEQFARAERSTSFGILLAAWFGVLALYTHQSDLIVGVPVAVRPFPEAQEIVGALTNILPIRAKVRLRHSFRELARIVRERLFAGFAQQDMPFDRVVREIALQRDPSRMPVVETMFNLLNTPMREVPFAPGLTGELIATDTDTARFDLALDMSPSEGGYVGRFEYRSDLFEEATIVAIARSFVELLERGVAEPDGAIVSLGRGRDEARDVARQEATFVESQARALCLHELVDDTVRRSPDVIAIEDGQGRAVTYAELGTASLKLATALIARGVGRGARVALVLDPGEASSIVALLAVLQCGAAYVPLDAALVARRVEEILADSKPALVIGEGWGVSIAQLLEEEVDAGTVAQPQVCADDPAYVIYTSGSTGGPKGVVVPHRGAVHVVREIIDAFSLGPDDRVLQFVSPAFDVAVSEIFMALGSGATLCLLRPGDRLPGAELVELLRQRSITMISWPASVLSVLPFAALPRLRAMIVGGETAGQDAADRWAQQRAMYLAYGPTEASVCATHGPYEAGRVRSIGRPLRHVAAYILDPELQPVLPGMGGELYIGGPGVAQGYLDRPDLTALAFVPDPFGRTPGARLYRSGDRAKRMPEGSLEFLGRRDEQIKIRGYRVEVAEIEAVMRAAPTVEEAAVVWSRDASGTVTLRGYALARHLGIALREYLEARLPAYMVPTTIETCSSFPRTASGKIDKRALAALPPAASAPAIAPEDAIEATILAIWKRLLGSEPPSRETSFFEVGGHSLLAVRFLTEIDGALGVRLPTPAIYRRPSVAALAAAVRATRQGLAPSTHGGTLVELASGAASPVFFVHGIDGGVGSYRNLADAWRGRRTLFAFGARGLEPGEEPRRSVEELAAAYVTALLDAHSGPFSIGGWSFGGLVAAEMSRRLVESGRRPSRLVLLDSNIFTPAELAPFAGEEQLRARFAHEAPTMAADMVERAYAVFAAHFAAQQQHHLGTIDVPTIVVQAESSPIAARSLSRWRDIIRAELSVHRLVGDHFSIVSASTATSLVELLERELAP